MAYGDVSEGKMQQFDPASERHYFGFQVKVVDPGCTLEYQVEEADGTVTRLTTTEDSVADSNQLQNIVADVVRRLLERSAEIARLGY